jgi:hypothetical protein
LILALAIPVVVAANANPPSAPQYVLAAGASPGAPSAKPPKPEKARGPKEGRGPGQGAGNGLANRPGKGPITVRSINGSEIVLGTEDGWTRTISVGSDTAVTKGGATVGVSALRVGDIVRFRQKRNDDGSFAVTAIVVAAPRAGGEVTNIDGDAITVKGPGGTTRVINVNGATVYKRGPDAASKADIKVGDEIEVQGTLDGDTFTATMVRIELAHAGGKVTAKTSDSITVTERDGSTTVIHVTGTTTFKGKGDAATTLADIAVGDRLNAEGTARPDGSLDAATVHAGPTKPDRANGPKGPKPPKAPKAPESSEAPDS